MKSVMTLAAYIITDIFNFNFEFQKTFNFVCILCLAVPLK